MVSATLRPDDVLVQFRDKNLTLLGSIPYEDLRLRMQPVYNGIGSWMVQLPTEHRAVQYLRQPGAGVLVTNLRTGGTLLSGSATKPSGRATIEDPVGMTTIAGLTDDALLWQALAFPEPTNPDPATQAVSNDIRSQAAESLMRYFVNANIGPAAPVARRGSSLRNKVVLGSSAGLGATITRRPRFDNLGDLLVGIATEAGLGFRMVQVGTTIEFQVYAPVDRSAAIRLDIVNGTLSEQSVETAPPEVTRMIVAGQGEGTERQIIQRTNAVATQAETDWGLIIEEWKDHRNTNVTTELQSAGDERLAEAGFTKVAVKAVPANDQTMIFMTDFFMGDKVRVVIDGQEQPTTNITEAVIMVDMDGLKTAVAVGDVKDFDSASALRSQVTDTQHRVDNLERNAEARGTALSAVGQEVTDWNDATSTGFYWSTAGAANRPYNVSFVSGYVFMNWQTGFERIVQEVMVPSSQYTHTKYMRIGFYSSGVLTWTAWVRDDGIITPASLPGNISGGTWDPTTGRINLTAGAKEVVVDGLTDTRYRSWRMDYFFYTGDNNGALLSLRVGVNDLSGTPYNTQSMYVTGTGTPGAMQQLATARIPLTIQNFFGRKGYIVVDNVKNGGSGVQKTYEGRDGASGSGAAIHDYAGWVSGSDSTEIQGVKLSLSSLAGNGFAAGGWLQFRGVA